MKTYSRHTRVIRIVVMWLLINWFLLIIFCVSSTVDLSVNYCCFFVLFVQILIVVSALIMSVCALADKGIIGLIFG